MRSRSLTGGERISRYRHRPLARTQGAANHKLAGQERGTGPVLLSAICSLVNMQASSVEAREVNIAGHQLRCQVCDYTRFFRREAGLSTGASTFGQDWATSKANCFICEQCGYVHWFVRSRAAAMAAEDTTLGREIEALRQRLEAEDVEPLETSRS